MRQTLVKTLYRQWSSMAIGAVCGIITNGAAAYVSRNAFLVAGAILLSIVAIGRLVAPLYLRRPCHRRNARVLEIVYETGAFTYSALVGLMCAFAIWAMIDPAVQMLLLGNAIGYGVGISARNAGRPVIALGQLFLCLIPPILACFLSGNLALAMLGFGMLMLLPAMVEITLNVFQLLRRSISTAETSQKLADKMQQLARTDVVTGLANRAGLNHQMVERLMVVGSDRKLALFWMDLDRFKEVNDTLGHPVGDRVLTEIARRLQALELDDTTIARFGGDEFIVVTEVGSRKESEDVAQAILAAINRPIRIDADRLELGASMGIALMPDDGSDFDTLMQSADLALYDAKINGRNRATFFDGSMTRDLVRRKEIEAELRHAIQRDELSIFFQPIVDLETGRIRTFEALVRWFHPQRGEMRPDEFIPVAEDTGLIITLGNWITQQAAKACAQWPEDVTIAVNLSPIQIRAPGAALGILAALREARLDPTRLELEVTESLFLEDSENTARFIEELSGHGVRFALDDFGTGYSSLAYIDKFPFKKIKVDRSFVSGKDVGRKSEAIIRAVAEMGNQLEMDIVAEGLETVEQVQAVKNAGCTLGQGYYFSRAVPDYLAAILLSNEHGKAAAAKTTGS
ncbi:EAL domain-containing protein [Alteriqipengyuania flavescens]|uniref:putative bifunctional diguanylate cyclase/phosphodiesterase n=1 Tax=Alteriqipengyuania flavescens TaxID=3053610 RepID=UPI0025B3140A|nr:EAL domain-containing protein [Alteriqipengyuania flavescens]WJY17961.1 EAL domain-containing protein [Alteriqipengyuania flavescens]WJY23902.1 EAL domain-containing protein [Alteriqipengyuania flavescens]